jgi:putative transposon-encoded protein
MTKALTREIETEVTKIGSGAHAYVPKAWIGKRVKVILVENKEARADQ